MNETYIVTISYTGLRPSKESNSGTLDVSELFDVYNSYDKASNVLDYATAIARNHIQAGFAKDALVIVLRYIPEKSDLAYIHSIHV